MLFDYVISGLYMRVLKLTWEKLNSAHFSSVFCFSVWRVRTGVDQSAGRLWSRLDARGTKWLDGKVTRLNACDLSAYFWGSALLDGINTPSGRGPDMLYIYPGRCISTLPHQKVIFWPLVSNVLRAFEIILLLLVFLCINLTFQVFF
jgi:hypothetical protein